MKQTTKQTTKVLRIGIVTATFPFGPAETFLRFELEALLELGYKLTILPATPRSSRNFHPDLKIDVVRFSLLAPNTLLRALRGLRRNVRAAFYAMMTILCARNAITTKLKNLALFPTGLAVAEEACSRHLSHLHAYWLSGASTVAFVASQVAGIAWSYSAHSWDIFMANNLIAEKTKSAKFGRVISELGRRGILRSSDAAGSRVHVIHLGVSPVDQHRPTGQGDGADTPMRLLCAADLIPVKGHNYLLEALRQVTSAGINCHCVFAGKGPLRATLARKIKQLGLENIVSMPGRIDHDVLLQQLRSRIYDAVVLASVELGPEFEGIPVSLMEAMAAGIPCIATSTGAIGELIDASCGILVEQRNPQALSGAIITLALDRGRREHLRKHAMRRIAEGFDARASAGSLARLMTSTDLKQR